MRKRFRSSAARANDATDHDVRKFAIEALGRMEEHGAPAVPLLVELLHEESTREVASVALSNLGAVAAPATVALLHAPEDDVEVRRSAAEALAAMDSLELESIADSLGALLAGDELLRGYIAAAYVKVAPPGEWQRGLGALVDGLNADYRVAGASAKAFEHLAPEMRPDAVALLLEQRNERGSFPANVSWALGNLGEDAREAVPALVVSLDNRSHRIAAAVALGKIGASANAAVPKLVAALGSDERQFQQAVVTALGQIGSESRIAVPRLLDILATSEEDERMREAVAAALGGIGEAAGDEAAAVLEQMAHAEGRARIRAAGALAQVSPVDARRVAEELAARLEIEYWSAPDRGPARLVVQALGEMGSAAAPAVPILMRSAQVGVLWEMEAFESLGKVGPPAADAIPLFADHLERTDLSYTTMQRKTLIVEALAMIGGTEANALLKAARDDVFYDVRKAAALALRR